MTKFEMIKEAVKKDLPALKKQYNIKLIGFFGSFTRGKREKIAI